MLGLTFRTQSVMHGEDTGILHFSVFVTKSAKIGLSTLQSVPVCDSCILVVYKVQFHSK